MNNLLKLNILAFDELHCCCDVSLSSACCVNSFKSVLFLFTYFYSKNNSNRKEITNKKGSAWIKKDEKVVRVNP